MHNVASFPASLVNYILCHLVIKRVSTEMLPHLFLFQTSLDCIWTYEKVKL